MTHERLDLTNETLDKKYKIKKTIKEKIIDKDIQKLTSKEKDELLFALARLHELID